MKTALSLLALGAALALSGAAFAADKDLPQVPQASAPNVPPARQGGGSVTWRLDMRYEEKALHIMKGTDQDTVYPFWTFNGQVPGPIFRVREGDSIEVHSINGDKNSMGHDVDFHAVSGPGGGSVVTLAAPGETAVARFKLLYPGLYVYHCAAAPVTWHIANGMYGLIIVDPKRGLPKVDHEYYVMQSEIYTKKPFGSEGLQEFDDQAAQNERPTYVVFNGAVDSLTGDHALKAKVGETVRLWFGNAGPNLISSFHVIGVIFGTFYDFGSFDNPMHNVQTTLVPAGGAAVVDFTPRVPGKYSLVDHSIFRTQEGALGLLDVDGPAQPDIYQALSGSAAAE